MPSRNELCSIAVVVPSLDKAESSRTFKKKVLSPLKDLLADDAVLGVRLLVADDATHEQVAGLLHTEDERVQLLVVGDVDKIDVEYVAYYAYVHGAEKVLIIPRRRRLPTRTEVLRNAPHWMVSEHRYTRTLC